MVEYGEGYLHISMPGNLSHSAETGESAQPKHLQRQMGRNLRGMRENQKYTYFGGR